MEECEICGKYTKTIKCNINSGVVNLCQNCAKMGEEIKQPKKIIQNNLDEENELFDLDTEEELADDWNKIIQKKRDALGLTIKQLAEKLNIRESVMKKIESRNFTLDDLTKSKIEKFFKIKLTKKKANFAINKMMVLLLAMITLAIIVILIIFFFDTGKDMVKDNIFSFISTIEE